MKQLLSLLLCLSIIVPSMAKKEQRKQNVFPDGTPISEWFLQTKVVHPDSLGKKYDLSDYGIESNPHTVWMMQFEIADLFGVFSCNVRKTIRAIYKNNELNEADTMRYIRQPDGISYDVYNLEMVIAIAFRICSKESAVFRRFIINEISTTKRETPVTLFVSCGRSNNRWYS